MHSCCPLSACTLAVHSERLHKRGINPGTGMQSQTKLGGPATAHVMLSSGIANTEPPRLLVSQITDQRQHYLQHA